MPLPLPSPKEKEQDFISRCIKFIMDEAKASGKKIDPKQAQAMAYSQWRRHQDNSEGRNKMKTIELSYTSELSFTEDDKLPLHIRGVALNAGLIESKHLIVPKEELQNLAQTLKDGMDGNGAYILPDHKKETTELLGRVTTAYNDGSKVVFEADIVDEPMAKKIRNGLVTYLSSGLSVGREECSICGADYLSEGCNHRLGHTYDGIVANLIGREIIGREISTVLYPADMGAKIDIAFSEAVDEVLKVIETQKERILNKEETGDININTTRGEIQTVSVLELTEAQVATHPFVADLMEKVSTFGESKLKYEHEIEALKKTVDDFKNAESARIEAHRVELVNTLLARRKEVGLPEKKAEDYKDISERSLQEMIDMTEEVSHRAKGIVEFSESDHVSAKEAMKKRLGW